MNKNSIVYVLEYQEKKMHVLALFEPEHRLLR
jgi:hypothetical protein